MRNTSIYVVYFCHFAIRVADWHEARPCTLDDWDKGIVSNLPGF